MKQPGIVLLVSPVKLLAQALVGPLAVDKCWSDPYVSMPRSSQIRRKMIRSMVF